jgi:hypothetical protein
MRPTDPGGRHNITPTGSGLNRVMARIQTMRDVTVHLGAAATAALSGSPNDEVHRRWFVQLAERIMNRAASICLIHAFSRAM